VFGPTHVVKNLVCLSPSLRRSPPRGGCLFAARSRARPGSACVSRLRSIVVSMLSKWAVIEWTVSCRHVVAGMVISGSGFITLRCEHLASRVSSSGRPGRRPCAADQLIIASVETSSTGMLSFRSLAATISVLAAVRCCEHDRMDDRNCVIPWPVQYCASHAFPRFSPRWHGLHASNRARGECTSHAGPSL